MENSNNQGIITRKEAEDLLKQKFGLEHFKESQWQGISEILKGHRVLMIQPTGFGKSLCFQFPAVMFDGLTLVFSPLKALMKDQVDHLAEVGISAAFLNTSIEDPQERKQILQNAIDGKYKILYIAPERMDNEDWRNAIQEMNISFVVVDEAHCISSWGHAFRPSYRRIVRLVKLLPNTCPVLAVTATANERTQHDIENQIGDNVVTIRGDLTRKNIQLKVCRVSSKDQLYTALVQYLKTIEGSGIIYAGSTTETELLARWLTFVGIPANYYHGKRNEQEKNEILEGLKADRWKCIVATSALGMGIDKPDIAFIVHTQIPESPIHYYQEIGRAGRNGMPSQAMLFYNEELNDDGIPEGKALSLSFVHNARPEIWKYERVIDELKKEPNTKQKLSALLDFNTKAVGTILEDLVDQGIVQETKKHLFEYLPNAPELSSVAFDSQKRDAMADLRKMEEYVTTTEPRMGFLCHFLDSWENPVYENCDNTNAPRFVPDDNHDLNLKLREFQENTFPVLKMKRPSNAPKVLLDGIAAGYYGMSTIGSLIRASKYVDVEPGEEYPDFDDYLVQQTVKAFKSKYEITDDSVILFVPPTKHGNLVKNFANRVGRILPCPVEDYIFKTKETEEQKKWTTTARKQSAIKDAFDCHNADRVKGKRVILIDDIWDSGATILEISRMLKSKEVAEIIPLVIAKTVGGDKL